MPNRPPNIFVFMSDQEQAQVVNPEHPCLTPVADKLARQGLLFRRCYTTSAHSCPARATYFTGFYPSVAKVYNNVCNAQKISGTYDPALTHFSQCLREADWNLGITGKWHCSDTEDPGERGWDEVYPTATKAAHMGVHWEQWTALAEKGFDFDTPRSPGEIVNPGYGRHLAYGVRPGGIEDTDDYKVVTRAIEAMERYAREDKPFLIHCGPTNPHDPYVVPQNYVDRYNLADVPLPPNYRDNLRDKPRLYQRQAQLWAQLSEDEVRDSVRHYWADCSLVDELRGMVYDAVDALGLRDNTVLIFTSDHGDYVGAHGLYCKGVPAFDEAMRLPLIVRWPEGIADPGREVDEFVTLADFHATFLELAGLDPLPTHGQSFAPFFRSGEVEGWPQEYYNQMGSVELWYTQRFVQTKYAKYVFNGFDFDELYDLDADPLEMVNRIDDPAYECLKNDMLKRLWKQARRTEDLIGIRYHTCALAPFGPVIGLAE
ncbi:MAG: hypothetical protein COS65_12270 [Armatimonadetes bacterium CG06_land_8_20_14_3_00_66_21]|nr:MAG: hypothetical protein COS65_12270 [Armatimonadetes bacterium CG06_land_8_20_14_3_00_66_21]